MKLILSPAKEMNGDALEEHDWEVSPAARKKVIETVEKCPKRTLHVCLSEREVAWKKIKLY